MKKATHPYTELHWPLIVSVCSLALLGCYNLHSAAAAHAPQLYLAQLFWLGVGALLCGLLLSVDYRLSESLAYLLYVVTCALLVVVLLQGKQAMGARRWLRLLGFTFQPSEIAKLATILCLARYFSTREVPLGYSIGSLVRPLNPSRPLLCMLALARFWQHPWLVDFCGELARSIHHQLAGTPPLLEHLRWFRILLISLLLSGTVASIWLVQRAAAAASLLHPWPAGRQRRILTVCILLAAFLLLLLALFWQAPVLEDPLGVLITYLDAQASPGGAYAQLHASLALPLLLACLSGVYGLASCSSLRRCLQRHSAVSWVDLCIAPCDILALPALLTLVQPDLGTAAIIILIGMTMILVVGVQLRSLLSMSVGATLIAVVAWFGILKDYQKRRILTFMDPEQDIRGAGWNAVQSLIAVGSGQWLGKGHKGGTQTQLSFLPEQHTDFAFSVWAEEMGFVGCSVVLLLYLSLLLWAFKIASEARELYGVLLAAGIAALILWQVLINVGMVLGVLPVVGLTLPLFSYGGSSLLTVMVGIGLLLNIHWRQRTA